MAGDCEGCLMAMTEFKQGLFIGLGVGVALAILSIAARSFL